MMSSDTSPPASITFLASVPSGVPAFTAARSMSPVEICGISYAPVVAGSHSRPERSLRKAAMLIPLLMREYCKAHLQRANEHIGPRQSSIDELDSE